MQVPPTPAKGTSTAQVPAVFKETAQLRWLGRSELNPGMPHRALQHSSFLSLGALHRPLMLSIAYRGEANTLCLCKKEATKRRWLQTGRSRRTSPVHRMWTDHCPKPALKTSFYTRSRSATLAVSTASSWHKSQKGLQASWIVTTPAWVYTRAFAS